MVSTTEVGGGNTPNGSAARKNQSKPNNKKPVGFKGDAKVESVHHGKVITSGSNQAGQIIALVLNLSSYIGDKSLLTGRRASAPYWGTHEMTLCQQMLAGGPMVPLLQVFSYGMLM